MASEQENTVFDQELDPADDEDSSPSSSSSSQSRDDDEEEDEDDDLRNGILLADDDMEDDDEEEESATAATTTTNAVVVPTALPSSSGVTIASVPTPSAAVSIEPSSPDDDNNPKRHRTVTELITPLTTPPAATTTTPAIVHQEEKKPLAVLDDSRRLFQRLWTDEDEIELLRGFLEYTAQRGGATSHQDTSLFYDQIKSKLQLEFNKNQLVEKLRRLKKKYRNVINKINSGKDFSFKSPHDQTTFEISSKIWSNLNSNIVNSNSANVNMDLNFDDDGGGIGTSSFNLNDGDVRFDDSLHKNNPRSRKRPRSNASVRVDDGVGNNVHNASNVNHNNSNNNSNNNDWNNGNVGRVIEEAVRSCVGPVFKELLSQVVATGSGVGVGSGGMMSGLVVNAMPLGFGGGDMMMVNEKWRKQKILELEVYSKRLELVQEQIRAQLEELRSMGG